MGMRIIEVLPYYSKKFRSPIDISAGRGDEQLTGSRRLEVRAKGYFGGHRYQRDGNLTGRQDRKRHAGICPQGNFDSTRGSAMTNYVRKEIEFFNYHC